MADPILNMDFTNGSATKAPIPAEACRHSPRAVTWQYVTPRTLARAEIDPQWETADADRSNNVFAGRIEPRTLGTETPAETRDRMRKSDLKVQLGSLANRPHRCAPLRFGCRHKSSPAPEAGEPAQHRAATAQAAANPSL